ncbi:MAG: helix-turn-helix transcriptional regulator [Candidatus Eremiobacteraeota bacterium]|nr:helix-turn-helix transcriptional regulator [Candidatus Eremiobacteraeota bacterium]MBV8721820.1 helix-turn-helix transcriptional regulator [Candidatus Eremiobacteraeota bacterium]
MQLDRLACGCPGDALAARIAGSYRVRRTAYVPECSLGVHAHAEHRIVLTLGAPFDSSYGRRAFSVDRWRAIFRPAGSEHADAYLEPTACVSVALPAAGDAAVTIVADDEFPALARRLSHELDATDSAAALATESLCAAIAGRFGSRQRFDVRPRWIARVRERLEEQLARPPSLTALARDVERDVSHVATTFRRSYGKTIGEFVRDARLWRCLRSLEDRSASLSEVALQAGFADQSHFGRYFKRRFGMTPGAYRARWQ